MEHARDRIHKTLSEVKAFLNQEAPPRLSEADTKANFIEPIVLALGWSGIGVVTREYYVKNSQEFIDYVMSGPSGPLLAIETKALHADLTDKNAAQLIQYCSVEGIEWAALTNGRELQFFNTFLRPDLAAKRILSIDLLAFNSDAEFDALFEQLSQLSRESMTTPGVVRTWLTQRRLDTALRAILLNPGSSTIKQLRRALADAEIRVTPQDLTQWFRSHLTTPIASIPAHAGRTAERATLEPLVLPRRTDERLPAHRDEPNGAVEVGSALSSTLQRAILERWPDTRWRETKYYIAGEVGGETFVAYRVRRRRLVVGLTLPDEVTSTRLSPNQGRFNWGRITRVLEIGEQGDIDADLLFLVGQARHHAAAAHRGHAHHGVSLRDLLAAGLLTPGMPLVLRSGNRELTEATLGAGGEILWNGGRYRSLSDRTFARLLGASRVSLNGWTHWHVVLPTGTEQLARVRERYLTSTKAADSPDSSAIA